MKTAKILMLVCCIVMFAAIFSGCGCRHIYGEWVIVAPATCAAVGVSERTCSTCGETDFRTIDALPHTLGEWKVTKEATCLSAGEESRACAFCSLSEKKVIPQLGDHAYGEWVVLKEATCTESGTRQRTCGGCNNTVTETVNAGGHNWKEATCRAPKTCTGCGATEGSAGTHSWTKASCEKPKTCTGCGATDGSALGHTWNAATCTSARKCAACGKADGSALGHDFNSNGACNRCGKRLTATDYAYLAGNDFRSVRRDYPHAVAQAGYVVLFTDRNGDLCVLTYVAFKIESNFSITTLHNLSTGKTITNPDDYYNNMAERYYGQNKIHYWNLANEAKEKEIIAMQGISDMLKNGTHSGAGAFVDAQTLNM